MKISEMLLREDFYRINEETLSEYFSDCKESEGLYIYPALNAITTKKTSKKVKQYLFNEYTVRGNRFRAFAVKAYVFAALNSMGALASKQLNIPNSMTPDKLIYPCNKKYRIFDFADNTVEVISKKGFPTSDLEREIQFRSSHKADFIPLLISNTEKSYKEKIINGMPLARISDGFQKLCVEAVTILEDYAEQIGAVSEKNACEYADILKKNIENIIESDEKKLNRKTLEKTVCKLLEKVSENSQVTLTLSHGDLQPGNVWVDNSGRIFIIDWESWGERSLWYDRAIMFDCVRSRGLEEYIRNTKSDTQWAIVCLEDIVFRLTELYNLPSDYGEKEFSDYINTLYTMIERISR